MKKCNSCGSMNEDSSKFCINCGTAFSEDGFQPKTAGPDTSYSPAASAPQRTLAQAKLKQIAGSRLALVLAIAFTLTLLCGIYTTMLIPQAIADYSDEIAGLAVSLEEYFETDISEYADMFTQAVDSATAEGSGMSITGALSGKIGTILVVVSMWIVFSSARNPEKLCCDNTGLAIMKVLRIIGLVVVSIFTVVLVGGLIALGVYLQYNYSEGAAIISYVCAGLFALIFLFTILFYAGIIRTLTRMTTICDNKPLKGKFSGYAGVIFFLSGICNIISFLALLAAASSVSGYFLVVAVATAAKAVYDFAASKFISRCRKEIPA